MGFDTIIRGGTVLDGTGAAARTADVGIKDGRISDIGAGLKDASARVLDADGALVTPALSTYTPTTTARPPGPSACRRHRITV